jgi:predicted transcriptional regulator
MPTFAKPRTATVTLKLDAAFRDRIKSLAATKKRSSHNLMKEAIERYLSFEEAQQAVLQSVDDSIAHFEATGLHITHEEVQAWAKEIRAKPEAQLPKCHA